MMFTVNGAGKTGTPVSSAGLGDHLQLHIWIDDLHVGKDITLTNEPPHEKTNSQHRRKQSRRSAKQ